ncbi:MAG: lycopene cyclase domain-containing protein [Balneolales bacterium]
MSYTYLLVNFFTILIPFVFSFHPDIRFHKTWRAFFPAVLLTGICFIAWDIWFTHLGVWGFNEQYFIGINIGNLPLEEILFFFCIPYACVFTFYCLDLYFKKNLSKKREDDITGVLTGFLLISAVLFHQQIYTMVTFASLALLLALARLYFKIDWLGKFYMVYVVLLIPFFIVNGILTGMVLDEPVVWYNETHIIGIRLGTIPLEDAFYAMALILLNLMIYRGLSDRSSECMS